VSFHSKASAYQPQPLPETKPEKVLIFQDHLTPSKGESGSVPSKKQQALPGYDADPPNRLEKITGCRRDPSSTGHGQGSLLHNKVQVCCTWAGSDIKTFVDLGLVKNSSHQDAILAVDFLETKLEFDKNPSPAKRRRADDGPSAAKTRLD